MDKGDKVFRQTNGNESPRRVTRSKSQEIALFVVTAFKALSWMVAFFVAVWIALNRYVLAQMLPEPGARFIPSDAAVMVLSALVTALTLFAIVVSVISVYQANRSQSEFDDLFEKINDRMNMAFEKMDDRMDVANAQMSKYEAFVDDLERLGLKSPVEIQNSIMVSINGILRSTYRPAEELKRDIIASIERDILEKIVDEYRSALAASVRK